MILRFGLRVGHAGQLAEVALGRVDADHLHPEVLREDAHDLVAFPVTQQAVIHEHAGQLVADGLVQQCRDHRGIHAARQAEQHLAGADLPAHPLDPVLDDVAGGPAGVAAADLVQEALVDARALARVRHLGMELQRVVAPCLVGHARDRHVARGGDDLEAPGQRHHPVAVAHPYVEQAVALVVDPVLDVGQQRRVATSAHLGVAELVHVARLHAAAELGRHGLHPVADPQHRHAELEHRGRRGRGARDGDRFRSAREDDAAGAEDPDLFLARVPGMDLAIDTQFPHPARDELRVLGPEIEDQDPVGMDVRGGSGHVCLVSRCDSSGLPW